MSEANVTDFLSKVESSICFGIGKLVCWHRRRPYESLVLDRICDALPPLARNCMRMQMSQLNITSHWDKGQTLTFSSYRKLWHVTPIVSAPFAFSDILLQPVASAIVRGYHNPENHQVRADLYISRGCLCQMSFEQSPRQVFGTSSPRPADIEVSDVHVLFDPMDANPFPCEHASSIEALPVWIRSLLCSRECAAIWGPLSEENRGRIVDYYDLAFPQDYLEFTACCEYLKCDELIEILGPSQAWVYVTPHEYVLKLADIVGYGALCLLRNREPGLYYIDNEEHIPIPVGNSFKEAVEKALTVGVQEWNDQCADFV